MMAATFAIFAGTVSLALADQGDKQGWALGARKQDYDRAIADYNEAIRLNPKDAIYYANRGNSYARKQDDDRAMAVCTGRRGISTARSQT